MTKHLILDKERKNWLVRNSKFELNIKNASPIEIYLRGFLLNEKRKLKYLRIYNK